MKSNILGVSYGICFLLLSTYSHTQMSKSERAVKNLLEQQAEDWNRGDLEAFMKGYWKDENLVFIGSRGPSYGWERTMANYKKGYPDKAAMGNLRFELDQIRQQSKNLVSVVGKFILTRKEEILDGYFLLLVKRIKGEWKVIADHTS